MFVLNLIGCNYIEPTDLYKFRYVCRLIILINHELIQIRCWSSYGHGVAKNIEWVLLLSWSYPSWSRSWSFSWRSRLWSWSYPSGSRSWSYSWWSRSRWSGCWSWWSWRGWWSWWSWVQAIVQSGPWALA